MQVQSTERRDGPRVSWSSLSRPISGRSRVPALPAHASKCPGARAAMAVTRRRPAPSGQGKAPASLVLPSQAASTARTVACLVLHLVVRAPSLDGTPAGLGTRRGRGWQTLTGTRRLPPPCFLCPLRTVLRRVRPDHRVALLLARRAHAAGIHRLRSLLPGASPAGLGATPVPSH